VEEGVVQNTTEQPQPLSFGFFPSSVTDHPQQKPTQISHAANPIIEVPSIFRTDSSCA